MSITSESDLKADCANCYALCCVCTAFGKSAEFAFDRMPGVACEIMSDDYHCGIHTSLVGAGMRGCTTFDCYGAGQKISNVTFQGRSWKDSDVVKTQMILTFSVMRPLHEMMWYLNDALSFCSPELRDELQAEYERVDALSQGDHKSLYKVTGETQRGLVYPVLVKASEKARAKFPDAPSFVGKDLTNKSFEGVDMRGADLTAAVLVNADLQGANLECADVLQVNFNHANVRGADLRHTMFLTQTQLNSCDGDDTTQIAEKFYRPQNWQN